MKSPIFGPSYVSRSTNLADNRLINLYPEIVETKQGKEIGALYGCPGLDLKARVGTGPIRGMHSCTLGLFVVSGTSFYKIDTSFSVTKLGDVAADGVVSITDNGTDGNQVAVFSGASGYVWSQASGFAAIALPFTGAAGMTAAYLDGYGIINKPNSSLLFQSDLLDLGQWNALNFGDASGNADDIKAIEVLRREIWVIKEVHTELWYDAGTSGFVFARLEGVYIEAGIAAVNSLAKASESLLWLAQNEEGRNIVVQTNGHQLRRVSTHAIEHEFGTYAKTSDAEGYAYQQDGHEFYVISFPTAGKTWCYDITSSALAGAPMWHERASFSGGQFGRHWGISGVSFGGFSLVGDYRNGNIYAFNLNTLTDNGAQRKWLRSWRALPQASSQPQRFSELRIDMQTGLGVDPETNPQAILRWSDDGGHNWSNEKYSGIGPAGATATRVMFSRLGSTRRNSGLDRVFELSSSDQFPVAIIGAEVE